LQETRRLLRRLAFLRSFLTAFTPPMMHVIACRAPWHAAFIFSCWRHFAGMPALRLYVALRALRVCRCEGSKSRSLLLPPAILGYKRDERCGEAMVRRVSAGEAARAALRLYFMPRLRNAGVSLYTPCDMEFSSSALAGARQKRASLRERQKCRGRNTRAQACAARVFARWRVSAPCGEPARRCLCLYYIQFSAGRGRGAHVAELFNEAGLRCHTPRRFRRGFPAFSSPIRCRCVRARRRYLFTHASFATRRGGSSRRCEEEVFARSARRRARRYSSAKSVALAG